MSGHDDSCEIMTKTGEGASIINYFWNLLNFNFGHFFFCRSIFRCLSGGKVRYMLLQRFSTFLELSALLICHFMIKFPRPLDHEAATLICCHEKFDVMF